MNRYRPYYFDPWKQQGFDAEMRQNTTGDWVRFGDHEAEVARLRGTLSLAEDAVEARDQALANCRKENERLNAFAAEPAAVVEQMSADAKERADESERLRAALDAARAELEATGLELIEARAQGVWLARRLGLRNSDG